MPKGRPPGGHLIHDGYEAAAAYIVKKLRDNKGPHVVQIRGDARVRVTRRSDFTASQLAQAVGALGYVGTYNRMARVEHIEDDLLHWLRQDNNK